MLWSTHIKYSHICLKKGNILHTKIVEMFIKFIKGTNFGKNQTN